MKIKTKKPTSNLASVPFEFSLPQANAVYLAGSFNDWNPTTSPLRRNGNGAWCATLQLPPGRYEYRLVIDGEWSDVPGVAEAIANPHGSYNAVLSVPPPSRAAHAA